MIRVRRGCLVASLVVFGAIAVGVSDAQAEAGSRWLILNENGETLSDGSFLAFVEGEIENEHVSLLTTLLGTPIEFLCTGAEIAGFHLDWKGLVTGGGTLRATGCVVKIKGEVVEGCEPSPPTGSTGSIETNQLKGLLVLHEGTALVRVQPLEGSTLATIYTGEECVIGEELPVEGVFYVGDCEGRATEHLVVHLIEEGPLTSLEVLGKPATVDGSALVSLTDFLNFGRSWGAMPG